MSYWRLFYHVIWATRDREPIITPTIESIVIRELAFFAAKHDIPIHAVGGTQDHVHLVVSIRPALSVASVVGQLKGASSRAVNAHSGLSGEFGWQNEYGVVSFAERHLPQVIAYVEHQKEHHAKQTLWRTLERLETTERN